MNSFVIFRRFDKVNSFQLLKKVLKPNFQNNIVTVSVLPSKSAISSCSQKDIKHFSQSAVKFSDNYKDHDHVRLWTAERALATAMLGIVPTAFLVSHPFMDYLLSLALTIHVHWGVEAIVIDYIRPDVFGKTIPKISLAAVYFISAFTLGGLFYFNYTDVGLVKAIKMFWTL